MENPKVLICECSSTEHNIIFQYDEDDKECYVSIHLTKLDLWSRIKQAFKYIFGYRSKCGDFDEIILNKSHADYLIELGNKLKGQ